MMGLAFFVMLHTYAQVRSSTLPHAHIVSTSKQENTFPELSDSQSASVGAGT